jgi:hypothetical protein
MVGVGLVMSLSPCAARKPDVQDRYKALLTYFWDHRVSEYGDVAVTKVNLLGQTEPVIAVFGFANNHDVCTEIVKYLSHDEPNVYRCEDLQH